MAASNAQALPPPNVAYRFYFWIVSSVTGNPITGGLTGLSCTLMKDGAAFVASTNAPVEVNNASAAPSGQGYVDLTAAEMNYSAIVANVSATNANAVTYKREVETSAVSQIALAAATGVWNTADYGDAAGRATTVLHQIAQIYRFDFNGGFVNKPAATITIYRDDGVTPMLSGPIVVNSAGATKVAMS